MLTIYIPESESYDEVNNEFVYIKPQKLVLEHSLVSISKWEAKTHKPFLSNNTKTTQEIIDYIECMTITQNVDSEVFKHIPNSEITKIEKYIDDPMTATTFSLRDEKRSNKIITSEVIYGWMVSLNIPVEFQKWHINRLLTLIRVCHEQQAPPKKLSKSEIFARNKALNAKRRKALHTKG